MPVDADVRNPSARPNQIGAELEGLRNAYGLDRDVDTESVRDLHDRGDWVGPAVVNGHVSAELPRLLQTGVGDVEHDDPSGGQKPGGHDRGEPDGTCADDRNGVARLDSSGKDADLIGRRQDVGEEDDL